MCEVTVIKAVREEYSVLLKNKKQNKKNTTHWVVIMYTRHWAGQWRLQNEYDMVPAADRSAFSVVGETGLQIYTVNVLYLRVDIWDMERKMR